MPEKLIGIVLNVRKYNDRNNIVTVYSRFHGRLSFISPIGSGKAGNARRARLQPLAVISSEFTFKAGQELQRLGSISLEEVWNDIYFDPVKRLFSVFISEFLYRLLNATMEDESLWDFILNSLRYLDYQKEKIKDFNFPFLVSLLSYSGIQPDVSGYSPEKVFDFASGTFVDPYEAKGRVLKGEESKAVKWVTRLNFRNVTRLRLSTAERRRLLDVLLDYYSFHFPGVSSMKSVNVIREIFT